MPATDKPRRCPTCRTGTLATAVIDYRADIDHDGRPYPVTVPGLSVRQCSNRDCRAAVLDDAAGERVSDALRAAAGLLTPRDIRRQRDSFGLPAAELAAMLEVPLATLTRWEVGEQIQRQEDDIRLRLIFASLDWAKSNSRWTTANHSASAPALPLATV